MTLLAILVLILGVSGDACGGDQESIHTLSPTQGGSTEDFQLVKGDPKDLIIQLDDLPSGFQMVAGEYVELNEYAAVYFRLRPLTVTKSVKNICWV